MIVNLVLVEGGWDSRKNLAFPFIPQWSRVTKGILYMCHNDSLARTASASIATIIICLLLEPRP